MNNFFEEIKLIKNLYKNSNNNIILFNNNFEIIWHNQEINHYFGLITIDNKFKTQVLNMSNSCILNKLNNECFFNMHFSSNFFNQVTLNFSQIRPDIPLYICQVKSLINSNKSHNLAFYNFSKYCRNILSSNDIVINAINKVLLDTDIYESDIYVETLLRNNFKLLRQINNLSIADKIINKNDFNFSYENFTDFINNLYKSISLMLPNTLDVKINCNNLCEDIYTAFLKEELTIVLTNIINNSLTFTRDNNTINLDIKKQNNNIIIKIKDKGIGIKDKIINSVRSPFFSYNENKSQSSLGLGLFICDQILALHNGSMLINSEFGVGTNITISIPIKKCSNNSYDELVLKSPSKNYISDRFSPLYINLCDFVILPR
ncbi:MAG: sensor histidine kinase [Oscillospiraceae bacterium]